MKNVNQGEKQLCYCVFPQGSGQLRLQSCFYCSCDKNIIFVLGQDCLWHKQFFTIFALFIDIIHVICAHGRIISKNNAILFLYLPIFIGMLPTP